MPTNIEWVQNKDGSSGETWNPITGCTKLGPGCAHCYAERMARRLKAMGQPNYRNGFQLTVHPHMLNRPLHWKKPRMIFVNSMSDLFHQDVPLEFIQQVFKVMHEASWHTFQVLTKRANRLAALDAELDWPDNVWMGVSVENHDYTDRIDCLCRTHAAVKFLSLEPLLGPLSGLNLQAIDWVIVGGETGPGARPMDVQWARDLRDQCAEFGTPFFMKKMSGGGEPPPDLMIREFPQ